METAPQKSLGTEHAPPPSTDTTASTTVAY